jgi:hypothetical protein
MGLSGGWSDPPVETKGEVWGLKFIPCSTAALNCNTPLTPFTPVTDPVTPDDDDDVYLRLQHVCKLRKVKKDYNME